MKGAYLLMNDWQNQSRSKCVWKLFKMCLFSKRYHLTDKPIVQYLKAKYNLVKIFNFSHTDILVT